MNNKNKNSTDIINELSRNYLLSLQNDDTIPSKEIAELLYNYMKKLDAIKQFCDVSKIKYRESTKQYYIYVNRKQYTGKTKQELFDKLYSAYSMQACTLRMAYIEWMIWRRDIQTNPKTLLENKNEWTKYIEKSSLADMILTEIDINVLEDFYYDITKNFSINSKRLTNINVPDFL